MNQTKKNTSNPDALAEPGTAPNDKPEQEHSRSGVHHGVRRGVPLTRRPGDQDAGSFASGELDRGTLGGQRTTRVQTGSCSTASATCVRCWLSTSGITTSTGLIEHESGDYPDHHR
ncbi:MAG: hypothetical protein JWN00_1544 [Actinomycetia bacterium]|nr:hypothetical protein [Actinomycetes bacterium]